jgi:hypothetical protein
VLRPGSDRAGLLSRLQADQAFRRRAFLRVAWVAIGGITMISVALAVFAFILAPDLADGIALAGDVIVAATLLLAVIAAAVAVLAYAVSTGAPGLQVSVEFRHDYPVSYTQDDQGQIISATFPNLTAEIYLRNVNQYPAHNPAVIVRLRGMASDPEKPPPDWVVTGFQNEARSAVAGVTEVQWDGGASYSVHGYSRRRLPDLRLTELSTFPGVRPGFEWEMLADGYRRAVVMEAGFMVDSEAIRSGVHGSPGEWI